MRRAMRPKAQKDSAAALSRHTTSAADRAGLVVPVGERRDLRGGALAATVGVQDHLIGHLPGDEEGRRRRPQLFKNSRSQRNSAFSRRRRSSPARSSASSTAPVSPPEATPFARRTQHPNACSPTPLGRHMRHRTAGLYHQAGSLLPNSGTNPNTFCVDITRCSAHANLCQGPSAALP